MTRASSGEQLSCSGSAHLRALRQKGHELRILQHSNGKEHASPHVLDGKALVLSQYLVFRCAMGEKIQDVLHGQTCPPYNRLPRHHVWRRRDPLKQQRIVHLQVASDPVCSPVHAGFLARLRYSNCDGARQSYGTPLSGPGRHPTLDVWKAEPVPAGGNWARASAGSRTHPTRVVGFGCPSRRVHSRGTGVALSDGPVSWRRSRLLRWRRSCTLREPSDPRGTR